MLTNLTRDANLLIVRGKVSLSSVGDEPNSDKANRGKHDMPAQRKYIKASTVAEILGCSSKTVVRGAFGLKRIPLNPDAKRPTWLFELREVQEIVKRREELGR